MLSLPRLSASFACRPFKSIGGTFDGLMFSSSDSSTVNSDITRVRVYTHILWLRGIVSFINQIRL